MELHLPVMRCLHLVLFSAWSLAASDTEEVFGADNATVNVSYFHSALSTRGVMCTYHGDDHAWLCTGDKLSRVPSNLTSTSDKMTLKLKDAGIKILGEDSLTPYARILRKLYLINVSEFRTFGSRIFQNTTELETIYIRKAPKLTHIDEEVFSVHLPQLKVISIQRTALLAVPYLGNLIVDGILSTVDFENNQIQTIGSAWIKIRSEDLILNYNRITSVESMAFNGSQIGKLSLKGNTALTSIHTDAFVGLVSINTLDLSNTSITRLPTNGLKYLDVLNIQNTFTLKVFPSKYNFETLTEANLTYPHLCCAFQFPDKHDPEMHRKHEALLREMERKCPPTPRPPSHDGWHLPGTDGVFHEIVIRPRARVNISCGKLADSNNFTCYPEPDAFNPCEDIMGYWGLRIAVWFVAILAILGNLAVLIVLVSSRSNMTVPKFLMCNLAFADLCMGFYLTLIAGMDAHSIGEYFNHAIDWQTGLGCQVAGFLTVFSTELSIFTLTVITIERWYTITYAIHLNRRLKLKTSARIMATGWIYASVMAALPLADISGYAKTSICLPLTNRNDNDLVYLIALLIFNGLAFLAIVFCYGRMYSSVRGSREEAMPTTRTDMTVAKRMALLVFTDFVCWAPIAFFAIVTLAGRRLIDLTQTKILLVSVYPLNSCANPYLYALLTHQYRRDLFTLLARYGVCKDRAAKYKGTIGGVTPINNRRGITRDGEKRTTDDRQRGSVLTTTLTSSDVPVPNNNQASKNPAPGRIVNDCRDAVQEFDMARNVRADNGRCCGTEKNDSGEQPRTRTTAN